MVPGTVGVRITIHILIEFTELLRALRAGGHGARPLLVDRRVSLQTNRRGLLAVPLREWSPFIEYIEPCDRRFLSRMSVCCVRRLKSRSEKPSTHRHSIGNAANDFFVILTWNMLH